MDFLLDHDVPSRIGTFLEQHGHRVVRLREVLPITTDDPDILRFARDRGWFLVTCNIVDYVKFADAEFAVGRDISGLMLLERRRTREAECANVLHLLERAGESGLRGNMNFA